MPDDVCPQCGREFESIWGVTVGDAGGYKPVFGGPVVLDLGRCNNCNITFERTDAGPWRRPAAE